MGGEDFSRFSPISEDFSLPPGDSPSPRGLFRAKNSKLKTQKRHSQILQTWLISPKVSIFFSGVSSFEFWVLFARKKPGGREKKIGEKSLFSKKWPLFVENSRKSGLKKGRFSFPPEGQRNRGFFPPGFWRALCPSGDSPPGGCEKSSYYKFTKKILRN